MNVIINNSSPGTSRCQFQKKEAVEAIKDFSDAYYRVLGDEDLATDLITIIDANFNENKFTAEMGDNCILHEIFYDDSHGIMMSEFNIKIMLDIFGNNAYKLAEEIESKIEIELEKDKTKNNE